MWNSFSCAVGHLYILFGEMFIQIFYPFFESLFVLVLLYSLWVTHLMGMGFDFIIIAPLLPFLWSFFFVFGHEESFFGGFLCPPFDGCSTASCSFGALSGDEHTSFSSAIWVGCLFDALKCHKLFINFENESLNRSHHLQMFSPNCGLSFHFVYCFFCCAKPFEFK